MRTKVVIKIFLILFSINCSYAQYVPERFAIRTIDLEKDFNSVSNNYSFFVSVYNLNDKDWILKERKPSPYDDHLSKETIYTYIYMPGSNRVKNEKFTLAIKHKEDTMTLCIRHFGYLSEGEIIYLENFKFREGYYFFDMLKPDKRFKVEYEEKENNHIFLNISNLRKHKICRNKMTKIMNTR